MSSYSTPFFIYLWPIFWLPAIAVLLVWLINFLPNSTMSKKFDISELVSVTFGAYVCISTPFMLIMVAFYQQYGLDSAVTMVLIPALGGLAICAWLYAYFLDKRRQKKNNAALKND